MSQVRLIAITPNAEQTLGYVARVSNPSNQDNPDVGKLLRYCLKNGHWSVFEHAFATLEIETTRDIARQILRHRSFSFSEFCVAAGTLVTTVTAGGKTKKLPIEKLFKYQSDPRMQRVWDRGIRVYDEQSKTFVRAKLKEVFDTGKKECFEVTLDDGKKIQCTSEHRFLTQNGFSRLGDLQVGSVVAVNGQAAYQAKDWLQEAKQRSLKPGGGVAQIAQEAGVSYHTIRKWLKTHGLQFHKKENAIVAGGAWNKGLPSEQQPRFGSLHSDETREKMRAKAPKGEQAEFFRSGKPLTFRQRVAAWQNKYRNFFLKTLGEKCNVCGATEKLELDHVVAVSVDRSLAFEKSNIQVLCEACHTPKNIAESTAARQTIRWKEITSIEAVGIKQTYDLEVDHESHNYVANGIVTHNSQRYADASQLGDPVFRECRLQDEKNRQNSLICDDELLEDAWRNAQEDVWAVALENYKQALAHGIAKEQARALLPEGLTPSRLYMSGSIRSWLHYLDVRLDCGTQKEHRKIAGQVAQVLLKEIPTVMAAANHALMDYANP